jgi:aspartyl-tRNA(Asn)/glutamyl-tRNA(Gln) amidotransferase subunit A
MLNQMPSIRELARQIRNGQTTTLQIVDQCLQAITEHEKDINAFITVLTDEAQAQARRTDEEIKRGKDRGLLHGIPISIKDIIDLDGVPTTAASAVRQGHRATSDATVIARLRAAGAIFIGKCNLHEFAYGTTGEDSAFGPTRNPRAPDRLAGGSSSGSAASVAAGMALASIGTDTGGSIRIPAAACGVVGLKPTQGELITEGIVPLAPTLDHVGPLANTVGDAALIYQVMAGGARRIETDDVVWHTKQPRRQLGLLQPYFLDQLDADIRRSFEETVDHLRKAGYAIRELSIGHADTIATTYRLTQLYEAFQIHEHLLETRFDHYSPDVRDRLSLGRHVSEDDYHRMQVDRAVLQTEVDRNLDGIDALILPTLAIPAPTPGSTHALIDGQYQDLRAVSLRLTQLFNLTGHPAISLPTGTTPAGLPCATQLVGRRHHTESLLQLASELEATLES